jgi:hypothetical protein
VLLRARQLIVHVRRGDQPDALFEFSCPDCGRTNLHRLDRRDAATLIAAGVWPDRGPAPFELLEERSGPPIGWDDLIDFHQALTNRAMQLTEMRRDARPGHRPEKERDAA